MDFPQYRKLSNEKVFYRINDDRNFDEIQLMGSKGFFHSVKAEQYPEMLRIQDMLKCSEGYLESNQEAFEELLSRHQLG